MHWCEGGSELTITNSSSNFGSVSALAQGFVDKSFTTDQNWNVSRIVAPMDVSSLTGNITEISLGFIKDGQTDSSDLELKDDLLGTETNKPTVLDKDGYSLNNYGDDSYIWIENPGGLDYPVQDFKHLLDDQRPQKKIACQDKFTNVDGNGPVMSGADPTRPPLEGLRVYVRRLRDTRSLEQRSVTFRISNTATDSRNVIRDYGLQLDTGNAVIDSEIDPGETIVVARPPGVGNTLGGTDRENQLNFAGLRHRSGGISVACTPLMRPLKTPAAGIARPATSARATPSASTTNTSSAKRTTTPPSGTRSCGKTTMCTWSRTLARRTTSTTPSRSSSLTRT